MSAPATRADLAELRTEMFGKLATKADLDKFATKAELREEVAKLVTKAEHRETLEIWAGALIARIEELTRMIRIDLPGELARHVRAATEAHRAELAVIDEKYADLPERVAALEAKR